MDDDKFNPNDPANTPHSFQSVAFATMGHPLSFRGPCKVCKRGSGHHVHDVSPFPENRPHEYDPMFDGTGHSTKCELCGHGMGHALHEQSAAPGEAFVSARMLRWVKGAPEPERHAFEPVALGVFTEGCKVCGELEGNGNVHVLPAEPPAVMLVAPESLDCDVCGGCAEFPCTCVPTRCVCCTEHYVVVSLQRCGVCDACGHPTTAHKHPLDTPTEPERHVFVSSWDDTGAAGFIVCAVCGGQEDDGKRHIAPERHVFVLDGMGRATCGVCGGQEDDGKRHIAPERHVFERHVFEPGSDEPGDYPFETCVVCEGREDDRKRHFAPDQINRPEHYTAHPSGIECIQITEHMGFPLGNVMKYVWRADLKGDAVADLEKAVWYLRREIDRRRTCAE